jgi:hypothetical protein
MNRLIKGIYMSFLFRHAILFHTYYDIDTYGMTDHRTRIYKGGTNPLSISYFIFKYGTI